MKHYVPLISLLLLPGLIPQDYVLASSGNEASGCAYVDSDLDFPKSRLVSEVDEGCRDVGLAGRLADEAADPKDDTEQPQEGQHRPMAFANYGTTKRVEELCKWSPSCSATDRSCFGADHHFANRIGRASDTDGSQVQPQPFPAFCIQPHGPPG